MYYTRSHTLRRSHSIQHSSNIHLTFGIICRDLILDIYLTLESLLASDINLTLI